MGQIYVWCPTNLPMEAAERRFQEVLSRQQSGYEESFGRTYHRKQVRIGNVLVGSIATDLGVRGWSAWTRGPDSGLAWAGVCEEVLGDPFEPARVAELADLLIDRPERTKNWPGSFAVAAWVESRGRVAVLTGAAQSQTLWRTEGPGGWACGSRARPLLDLVRRSPELDVVQSSLFASFGYLAGSGALFRHVDRFESRHQASIDADGAVDLREYVGVADFLHDDDLAGMPLRESVRHAAASYAARVARQHRHSRAPVVSLTGGHDSRSIVAALSRQGLTAPTRTGGLPDSDDVVLAERVADELGFEHEHQSSERGLVERLHEVESRAVTWTRWSEGVETIRHALHYDEFFSSRRPFAGDREQNFNGLRPFLNRRDSPAWQRDALREKIGDELLHRDDARSHFDDQMKRIERSVAAAEGTATHIAELHFWQVKVLHSGQDNILTKDMFSQWWTPLVDATLIRANWRLPTDRLPRATFIDSITGALAPELTRIPFQGPPATWWQKLLARIVRRLPRPLRPPRSSSFAVSPQRSAYWEAILWDPDAVVWKDIVEPATVRSRIDSGRGHQLLWTLATLELFAKAHLGAPYEPVAPLRVHALSSSNATPIPGGHT